MDKSQNWMPFIMVIALIEEKIKTFPFPLSAGVQPRLESCGVLVVKSK